MWAPGPRAPWPRLRRDRVARAPTKRIVGDFGAAGRLFKDGGAETVNCPMVYFSLLRPTSLKVWTEENQALGYDALSGVEREREIQVWCRVPRCTGRHKTWKDDQGHDRIPVLPGIPLCIGQVAPGRFFSYPEKERKNTATQILSLLKILLVKTRGPCRPGFDTSAWYSIIVCKIIPQGYTLIPSCLRGPALGP